MEAMIINNNFHYELVPLEINNNCPQVFINGHGYSVVMDKDNKPMVKVFEYYKELISYITENQFKIIKNV